MTTKKTKGVKCSIHDTEHPREIHDFFKDHCKRLGLKVKRGDCPIRVVMESERSINILEPDYTIIPKTCTDKDIQWPTNIDLLITKLPTTQKEGYSKGLVGFIANRTWQFMNNNSLAYVIVSSYKEDKARFTDVIQTFRDAGFNFIDSIIWVKNKYTPTQGGKRLNNVYDFILMFSKGDNYHLNRQIVSNIRLSDEEESNDDRYLCPGNVWKIDMQEKDVLPDQLIRSIIDLSNILPRFTVVDPFMGDGTVLKVALENNLTFWGCESEKSKFSKCKKIVNKYRKNMEEESGDETQEKAIKSKKSIQTKIRSSAVKRVGAKARKAG